MSSANGLATVALAQTGRVRINGRAGRQLVATHEARIMHALVDTVDRDGFESASVSRIVGRAGMSRRTFYELYADRDHCLLSTIEHAVCAARERVVFACAAHVGWEEKVRAGLSAALEFLDEDPAVAKLCLVHWLRTGPRGLARRNALCGELARAIDQGRADAPSEPAPATADAVVGGVLGLLHARLVQDGTRPLVELTNELMSFILLPYRGVQAARAELERAPTACRSPRWRPDLRVRMTYRTAMTLAVIAAHPGLSNNEIGDRAGVVDRGQMSKLLARLARLGLISNNNAGYRRGGSNAWRLTSKGIELERVINRKSYGVSL